MQDCKDWARKAWSSSILHPSSQREREREREREKYQVSGLFIRSCELHQLYTDCLGMIFGGIV